MNVKKMIQVGGIITIVGLIAGSISNKIEQIITYNNNYNLECYGIIEDIRISDERATPYFLIGGEWKYLNLYGFNMVKHTEKYDSVAKAKGEKVLYLYRKNNLGTYRLVLETTPRKRELYQ
ncbi:MAG: hypothetical protein RLN88_12870 [Ekhidna sp.]|uniref:hypothetical protein n=1 Tax=Ekhidna sp. TaxID=2608089 RepID=UPI0032EDAA89